MQAAIISPWTTSIFAAGDWTSANEAELRAARATRRRLAKRGVTAPALDELIEAYAAARLSLRMRKV